MDHGSPHLAVWRRGVRGVADEHHMTARPAALQVSKQRQTTHSQNNLAAAGFRAFVLIMHSCILVCATVRSPTSGHAQVHCGGAD